MSAPARPPSFFDTLSGRDIPHPEALREPGFLIDDLARDAAEWPDWLLDDDSARKIRLSVIEHVIETRVVIGFTVDGLAGTITAVPDSSGYLRVVVKCRGAEVLRTYVERVWEEHELWPPGALAAIGEESPGRLGKRRTWVSISAKGWPVLAAIANDHGWVNLRQVE